MEKLHSHRIKSVVSMFMLALISFTLLSKAFFIHTHISSDGQIVAHAHPFQKSDSENKQNSSHSHSDFELFSWLTYDSFEDSSSIVSFDMRSVELEEFSIPQTIGVYTYNISHTRGRAPPAMA